VKFRLSRLWTFKWPYLCPKLLYYDIEYLGGKLLQHKTKISLSKIWPKRLVLCWRVTNVFVRSLNFNECFCTFIELQQMCLYVHWTSTNVSVRSLNFNECFCTFIEFQRMFLYVYWTSTNVSVRSLNFNECFCTFIELQWIFLYIHWTSTNVSVRSLNFNECFCTFIELQRMFLYVYWTSTNVSVRSLNFNECFCTFIELFAVFSLCLLEITGLSLGAGDRQYSPPYSTSHRRLLKKNFVFVSISGLYFNPINKMIKLTKKPLNFLMQSLQFLIPGKVWGIL
jgi:hypothetical protein